MDLDRINIEARLRSPWEAMDLGFVLVRKWWKPLFLSWFIPSAIVFTILSVVFVQNTWVPYFVVWWCKPLFDRGPLYMISRLIFGEQVTVRDVFRNLWRLYKTEAFLWLTLRRISFTRSFDMPLTVLEKITSKQRTARQTVLHRRYSSAATWLTIAGFFVEACLTFGFMIFFAIMIPEQVEIDYWQAIIEQGTITTWIGNISVFVSMALIGPFYAVAGFALYISRRIELEAWDIEIRFRLLASSYEKKQQTIAPQKTSTLTALGFAALLAFSLSLAPEARAEETPTDYVASEPPVSTLSSPQAVKEKMFDILEGDEFHRREVVSGWRVKNVKETDEIPGWLIWIVEFFENNGEGISKIVKVISTPLLFIEYILWGALVLLIIFLIIRFRKQIGHFVANTEPVDKEREVPAVMFGLEVTKESLPDDIPGSVRKLWEQGEYRAAVSLLYRALLTGLIHDYDFTFADSNTEGECVAIVKQRGDKTLNDYVVRLTRCWQNLAYGHLLPRRDDINALCENWVRVFPNESH